jgi:hypothetical protein
LCVPVAACWLGRYARDAASSSKLDLARYLQFLTEFNVIPALCTQAQAEKVFELVNMCDEYVATSPALPSREGGH